MAKGRLWPRYLVLVNVRDKRRVMLNVLDEWEDMIKGVGT
jgi:hypothetical protein